MQTFDQGEYDRWMRTAQRNLQASQHNAAPFPSTAVLLAEQAAQCGLKGLLHGVGAGALARGHGLLGLAAACQDRAGLPLTDDDRGALARLAREYQATRSPEALPGGSPADHYAQEDAQPAWAVAQRVVTAVDDTWGALQAAAQGKGRDTDGRDPTDT